MFDIFVYMLKQIYLDSIVDMQKSIEGMQNYALYAEDYLEDYISKFSDIYLLIYKICFFPS